MGLGGAEMLCDRSAGGDRRSVMMESIVDRGMERVCISD